MATMAYTKIIAIGNKESIDLYASEIHLNNCFLDLEKLSPQPSHFSQSYWEQSIENKNEIRTWRANNWGTDMPIVVNKVINDHRPEELSLHIMHLETKYIHPLGYIEKIADKFTNLDFLIEVELEPSYSILEYYDNKKMDCTRIFEIQDFYDEQFFEKLTPQYLDKFEKILINKQIREALLYTESGKIYLDLNFPNGTPFSLI